MRFIVLVLLILSLLPSVAQKKTTGASATLSFDQSLYSGIRWREVGPYRGGRSGTVTGVAGHPGLYYFGAVGGGVWRTKDAGQTWENITDNYFGGTIGAVAVSESDPNVIYVGEGE
jgi:hypothetical protein